MTQLSFGNGQSAVEVTDMTEDRRLSVRCEPFVVESK